MADDGVRSDTPLPSRTRRRVTFATVALIAVLLLIFAIARMMSGDEPSAAAPPEPIASAADMPLAVTAYPAPPDSIFVSREGSDEASGSERSPLRTLRAAVGRVPTGGTVVLRGGTYREGIGTLNKRVTIQPFPGERVWLNGSVVVSGWSRNGAVWEHHGWNVDLCQRCYLPAIIDAAHPLAGLPDMVFVNGTPLRQVKRWDAVERGTFYVDRKRHVLVIGDDPAGKNVESAAHDHLVQLESGAAGSVIRGIGIAQYAANQDYGNHGAMVIVNAPNVTLERDTFGWSASSGAMVLQPGARLIDNSFVDNGLVGMVANRADDLRLIGNRFSGNNQERFSLSGEAIGAAGAKITRTRRPYVADNNFTHNHATGWWCDLGCTDATVIRNVSEGNAVNGLSYEVSSRALIASNTVLHNGSRGLKISSSDRVRVHNNTFSDNPVSIGLYNDPRSPGSDPYSAALKLPWITERTVLVNNLFFRRTPNSPVIESDGDKPRQPMAAFVSLSDGNAYLDMGKRPEPLVVWSRGSGRFDSFDSLKDLRRETGQEAHSLDATVPSSPFRASDRGDYQLRPGAPGVAAGRPLPAGVAKALGITTEQRPDIGIL